MVTLKLPYLVCVTCLTQLVTHLFADLDGAPVCLFCARDHHGPGLVRSVSPDAHGFLPGVEAMSEPDAVRLLVSLGARAVAS